MPKKLIALISTEGKSADQIFEELQLALRQTPSKPTQKKKQKYYCPKCNREVTRIPISSYTNEEGKSIHIPHFGRAHCTNCGWQSEPYGRGLIYSQPFPNR